MHRVLRVVAPVRRKLTCARCMPLPVQASTLRIEIAQERIASLAREERWRQCLQLDPELSPEKQALSGDEEQEEDRRTALERKPAELLQAVNGQIEIAGP